MLLRSISKHVKDQNWFAVFLDFFIVVAGILIAFQITNWNETRLEQENQQVYLLRLTSDFQGLRQRLDRHVEYYSTANEASLYLLALINAESGDELSALIDSNRIQDAYAAISLPRITPRAPSTYIEMLSEGQLSRIQSTELRDKLAGHDRLLSVVTESGRVVVDQYARQEHILYRHVNFVTVTNENNLTGVTRELRSYDIEGMRSDKEFATVVAFTQSNALTTLAQRKFQLRLINDIIDILDRELN